MFNLEKLLGGLISSGISRRGNALVPGGVALGPLGVAMEAVSHYWALTLFDSFGRNP
jgi:hypothetical protein